MAATALLSSPPLPSSSNPSIFSTPLKKQSKILWKQKKCGKFRVCSEFCKEPTFHYGVSRRDLTLIALSSSLSLFFPYSGFTAEEELKMGSSVDDINAYSYLYPIEMPSKKFVFKWVETRKPERYSSAAPLSRPPNSQFLKSKEKSTWSAKDVADSVLSDKSALRVTSTQRLAESSLLDAHASEIDSEPYWYYEYLVRKSPTKAAAQEPNLFRHYVASTAERDDGTLLRKDSGIFPTSSSYGKLCPSIQGSMEVLVIAVQGVVRINMLLLIAGSQRSKCG
ncbi:psbP domain-containing protein 5, chloroplastic isoform X3 [Solanum dulcamara]|uniref:psbP domain-containing protein 5, chloroplastic isoform X3 n=1 Tax=Solanum dulcamara TaxID=45834 RepID=UPI0024868F0E|nr:psbP domain-containing protein 5, chloroplastic isoform X3 [Solanum dulcamara]